jgi:hypothetical protein
MVLKRVEERGKRRERRMVGVTGVYTLSKPTKYPLTLVKNSGSRP